MDQKTRIYASLKLLVPKNLSRIKKFMTLNCLVSDHKIEPKLFWNGVKVFREYAGCSQGVGEVRGVQLGVDRVLQGVPLGLEEVEEDSWMRIKMVCLKYFTFLLNLVFLVSQYYNNEIKNMIFI